MNKTVAVYRREIIAQICLGKGYGWARSVDDYYRRVCNNWPDGFADSPGKNTVKSVLLNLASEGKMKECSIHRGYFHQLRFKVVG